MFVIKTVVSLVSLNSTIKNLLKKHSELVKESENLAKILGVSSNSTSIASKLISQIIEQASALVPLPKQWVFLTLKINSGIKIVSKYFSFSTNC